MKSPKNSNYCATVVEIQNTIKLDNCDNVQHAIILGNHVVVGNDINKGDIGIYFPLETQLSKEYLSANNLYRKKELNSDKTKAGYFEENGRIRCVKFRGNKSEGLFMPVESIINLIESYGEYEDNKFEALLVGDEFDELDGIPVCNKYIPKNSKTPGVPGSKKQYSKNKLENFLYDNQFKFHEDTSMLYKNMHKIKPNSLISITYKLHGSSGIVSNVLIKKKMKWYEMVLKKLRVDIPAEEYGYIYSSGKPKSKLPKGIIGSWKNNNKDYYASDIWKESYQKLKDYMQPGMSIYFEIVGFTESGSAIQKDFDYGKTPLDSTPYSIYIYRITHTNNEGDIFEFSAKQVQEWCHYKGLNAVPQLYYGYAKNLLKPLTGLEALNWKSEEQNLKDWQIKFLEKIKELYNEKDCYICKNKVPEEGCVIRIEGLDFEAFKAKSNRFYAKETKQLDKGLTNMEDEN